MNSLLLAVALLHQDPLAQKVEFTSSTKPLIEVVRLLSEQVHVPLKVLPAVTNTPMYIKSKDLTLKEIMDAIGAANFAEWRLEGGEYKLYPSKKAALVAAQEETARMVPVVEKYLAKQAEALKETVSKALIEQKLKDYDAAHPKSTNPNDEPMGDWQRSQSIQAYRPGNRFAASILQSIGVQDLASVRFGDRKVFSTHPTLLQGRLDPKVVGAAYARYRQERPIFREVDPRAYPDDRPSGVPYAMSQDGTEAPFPDADEIHVVISSGIEEGGLLLVQIETYDKNGKPTLPFQKLTIQNEGQQRFDPPKDPNAYFNYTAEGAEFNQLLKRSMDFRGNSGTVKNPERFMHVLDADPLSYTTTELMSAWIDAEGGQGVFSVPDLMCFLAAQTSEDGKRGSVAMCKMFAEQLPLFSQSKVGRVPILRPGSPKIAMMFTSDRARMDSYLQSVLKAGDVDAVQTARYLAQGDQFTFLELGRLMAAAYVGKPADESMSNMGSSLDKVYWRLTDAQRSMLDAGQAIPIAKLGPRANAALLESLYMAVPAMRVTDPRVPTDVKHIDQYNRGAFDVWCEPTKAFPDPPKEGQLTVMGFEELKWELTDGPEPNGHRNLGEGLPGLCDMLVSNEHPEVSYYPPGTQFGTYIMLKPNTVKMLDVDWGNNHHSTARVLDDVKRVTPKPVLADQLPEPYKSQIAKMKKESYERLKQMKGGG